jgi:circadian clock protein KaiB
MRTVKDVFKFRLFIAGNSPNSTLAVFNLNAFCRKHLPDRHEIELVDVFRNPAAALADGVTLTPKLVKLSPGPSCEIIGTLSNEPTVINALGLSA